MKKFFKGLAVVNAYANYQKVNFQVEALQKSFLELGITLEKIDTATLQAQICDGNSSVSKKDVDFVLYLDKDKHSALLLENLGFRLFNSAKSIEVCDDKMLTHIALADKGIKMPDTIHAPLCYVDGVVNSTVLDNAEKLGYPLVVKECFGSLGKQVYKVDNRAELESLHKKLLGKPHIFQKFIWQSQGQDVRLIVIGGKVVCAMERKSQTDFRANVELGAVGTKYDAPASYVELAEKVAKILGLDYCGVDLLHTTDGPLVCEVNSNAFFNEISKVCSVDVATLLAQYVYSKVYK